MGLDNSIADLQAFIPALLAEHEAGHAVMMSAFGWIVCEVSIASDAEMGFTKALIADAAPSLPDAVQRDLWASTMISAAGMAAELIKAESQRIIPPNATIVGTPSDNDKMFASLSALGLDLTNGKQFAFARAKAQSLLVRRYGFVEEIAGLLREHNTLDRGDIQHTLRRVPPITEDEWTSIKFTDLALLGL